MQVPASTHKIQDFFFFHSLNGLSQTQDTYKTLDILHMTFAAGEMGGAKLLLSFPF